MNRLWQGAEANDVRRCARGEKEQLIEEILNWLRENNLEPTVKNVLDLNYMGDVKSLRQLE